MFMIILNCCVRSVLSECAYIHVQYLIRYCSLSVLLVQYFLSMSGNSDSAKTDGANIVRFCVGSDR